jgi:hypothetical protein
MHPVSIKLLVRKPCVLEKSSIVQAMLLFAGLTRINAASQAAVQAAQAAVPTNI